MENPLCFRRTKGRSREGSTDVRHKRIVDRKRRDTVYKTYETSFIDIDKEKVTVLGRWKDGFLI